MRTVQMVEDFTHFIASEDNGQARRPFSSLDSLQPTDFLPEDFLVEKKQRTQGLVLGGRCNVPIASKMSKKFCHFCFRHVARMPFVMEPNEALDPIDIALLGPDAEMLSSNDVANLIEQFGFVLTRGSA